MEANIIVITLTVIGKAFKLILKSLLLTIMRTVVE